MVGRAQGFRRFRVLDDGTYLPANEISNRVVRGLIHHQIVEGVDEIDAPFAPAPFIFVGLHLGADLGGRLVAEFVKRAELPCTRTVFPVFCLPVPLHFGVKRSVPGGD